MPRKEDDCNDEEEYQNEDMSYGEARGNVLLYVVLC